MSRRIGYLVNPAAGSRRTREAWRRLQAELRSRGLAGEVRCTSAPGSAAAEAADLARSHDVVVAVGGDGTAMEVATGLVGSGTSTALAVLPLGSGNDTARLLGCGHLPAALDALASGALRSLDGIELRCTDLQGREVRRLALDFAGAAFVADLLRTTPTSWKHFGQGRLAYAIGFFRALARFHPPILTVSCDDWTVTAPMLAVLAANQEVSGGGGMRTGPGARPDDGWLDVSVVRSVGRLQTARQFLGLLRGTHIRHPAVTYRRARRIEIRSSAPVGIAADGDVLGTTPARFEIRPGAIRAVVGAGAGTRW